MRGWRWRGSAGGLRTLVGVMLLGFSMAQSVPPQTACAAAVTPQSLPSPQYQDTGNTDEGFMAALVQSFLHTVQPNPFPGDLILKIVDNVEQKSSNQDLVKEVLVYEVGFLVCTAIGILYIILMPIVGFFLACCRCCGNCGGKMYQKQTSSIHCRRRTLYWGAFVTTVIILAGNICMFRSNEALNVSVDQSPVKLNTTLDNIHTFLTSVPQQIDYVVNESYKTIQEVTTNLDDIGRQLGTEIQEQFNPTLGPALHPVIRLNQETRNTSVKLDKLNSSLAELQSSVDALQADVTVVRSRINETLSHPDCTGCNALKLELQALTLDTSITVSTGLSKLNEVENYFNSIPQRVVNDTKDVVQNSKQQLGDIKTQISQVTSNIPALTNVSGALNQARVEISKVTPEVERAENIRWSLCVALCCVVLLVVVCNLLGLVLGPAGLKPKADPTKRSCTVDCGGTFLMMGAGVSFLFSWLFMIVVLLLFLLGGNVYTLLCRPWNNGQLLKFIDSPGLIPGIDQTVGLNNISFSDVYRDCEDNKSLWTTLHLYEDIDLGEFLNVSKYTEQIRQQFEDTDITLSAITLLSPEVKKQLSSFSADAQSFDSTAITQQVVHRPTPGTARSKDHSPLLPSLSFCGSFSPLWLSQGTVGEVLSNVGAAQDFLNTNTTQIVKTESRKFLDCQLSYFVAYAEWANLTITQQVGRCRPVAGALDSLETIVCSRVVESLNAFWFSLGWCLIFFIPSIIFSIKLAKYYRKMKHSDVFEDHIIMNHIPRAQMKIT
uniref:Prominin 2 n=1 Tax=Seriola lalandi dorsalis TaxID=1841481 RepID=A0A3B4WH53_SERLL